MTRFEKIQGSTYYLPLPHCNVGLYLDKKQGVLIDSGYTEEDADLILELLDSQAINLTAVINTHAHPENSGGSYYLKKKRKCQILCSRPERLVMENPDRSNYMPSVKAAVPKETEAAGEDDQQEIPGEEKAIFKPRSCLIDGILTPGKTFETANKRKLRILDLAGHTQGQIGVLTQDGVIFTADALLPLEEFAATPIPFIESVSALKKSLDFLLRSEYSLFVPTHGHLIEFSITHEVLYNQQQIKMIEDAILMHLQMPRTKEELVALMFATFQLPESVPNFYTLTATVLAFLNHLKTEKKLTLIHEDGKTRWFAKS